MIVEASRRDAYARALFGEMSLWSLFEQQAERFGTSPWLIWQAFDQDSRIYSYADFRNEVASVAAGLMHRGVVSGDRILIHLENCPEFLVVWLACAAVGATAVTTNTRLSIDELQYCVDHAGVVGAVTQPKFLDSVIKVGGALRWISAIDHDAGVPAGAESHPGKDFSYEALRRPAATFQRRKIELLHPLSVQYTSGTTARPKGVVWTHANALWAARVNSANETLRADDCHFVYLPLFHANAMTFSVLPSLWAGARVLLTPKWSTSRFWEYSLRHRCSWLSLIGLSARAVMALQTPSNHSYRLFGTGVCVDNPPGVGVKTIGWWGMTETVGPGIVGDATSPNRTLAIGRAATQYQVAVFREDGTPADFDEAGQLMIRGTPGVTLFDHYLGNPLATSEAFDSNGWFKTGDLVTQHHDGYFSFVDRSKDMLRVGAENVAASEIERVIGEVNGVIEVAVVGRQDEKLDEVPIAFIVAHDPSAQDQLEAQVLLACRAKLADFKVPRAVYSVRAMPRSTIAKINKVELRAVSNPSSDRLAAERKWQAQQIGDPSGDAG